MSDHKWKVPIIIVFWIIVGIMSSLYTLYGWVIIDPLLYGLVYGGFFIICALIVYKFDLEIHNRLEIFLTGYLFQGVYDWIWWIIQYFDPNIPFEFAWNNQFYIDLVLKNSIVLNVFTVELINVIMGIYIVLKKKKDWNFLIFIICWLGIQITTATISKFSIPIDSYLSMYIFWAVVYSIYLFVKTMRKEERNEKI